MGTETTTTTICEADLAFGTDSGPPLPRPEMLLKRLSGRALRQCAVDLARTIEAVDVRRGRTLDAAEAHLRAPTPDTLAAARAAVTEVEWASYDLVISSPTEAAAAKAARWAGKAACASSSEEAQEAAEWALAFAVRWSSRPPVTAREEAMKVVQAHLVAEMT